MRKIAFVLVISSFLFSCQGNDSAVAQDRELLADSSLKSNSPGSNAVSEPAVAVNEGVTATPVNLPATQPQVVTQSQPVTQAQPVIKSQPVVQAKSYGTNTAPNPAHGQPGHRCDIAVGAPLNSAPTNATAQPTTTITNSSPTPTQTITAPAQTITTPAANTVTAPGMNPPHGQPGHDCSIAVGAPLKKN